MRTSALVMTSSALLFLDYSSPAFNGPLYNYNYDTWKLLGLDVGNLFFVLQSDILFLNCGHVCACSKCAELIHECPLDRSEIVQKIHLQPSSTVSSSAFPAEDDAAFWTAVVFSSVVDVVVLQWIVHFIQCSIYYFMYLNYFIIFLFLLDVKIIQYLFLYISFIYLNNISI